MILGFGQYGFETGVEGLSTERFVAEVQRRVRSEVDKLIRNY